MAVGETRSSALFRSSDQPDDFLHAGAIEVLARVHAGAISSSPRASSYWLGHQAGGQRIVILGAGLEPESFSKFLFSLGQLLRIHQRRSEIMVGQAGFGIERNGLAQHANGFLVFSGKKQGLPQNALFGRTGRIGGDGSLNSRMAEG